MMIPGRESDAGPAPGREETETDDMSFSELLMWAEESLQDARSYRTERDDVSAQRALRVDSLDRAVELIEAARKRLAEHPNERDMRYEMASHESNAQHQ